MSNILPPEWAPQDAIMITWPHANTDWAPILIDVEAVFLEISLSILARQQLVIVCHDQALKEHITQSLRRVDANIDKVGFIIANSHDCWARDHGPVCVLDSQGEVIALNFTFNGWGNKYPAKLDDLINQSLFTQLNISTYSDVNMVLEGGAIEVDGEGNLLTTKQCLLNSNRNPNLDKTTIELALKALLGVNHILWLEAGGLEGDDTDSHIDTLARFAPQKIIIFQGCDDINDSHFDELDKMKQELVKMRDSKGDSFTLMELPWPDAQFNGNGERLPATYANFLIINNAVLMPTYGTAQDEKAKMVLVEAFPKHKIVMINCRPIIEQFGSLHCLTMQLPKGFLASYR